LGQRDLDVFLLQFLDRRQVRLSEAYQYHRFARRSRRRILRETPSPQITKCDSWGLLCICSLRN
jgi:hypothetical protein